MNVNDQTSPLNVLVVEDERLLCWALAQTLSDAGCHVTEAPDGDAAIRALRETDAPLDVVLLDYQLPDVVHLDLLSTVRQLSRDSHVVLMSARCTPEIARDALALGAARVVAKPFDMNDVPAIVRDAAGRPPIAA
jgi:DNA-binding NtrC family response regulator